MNLTATGIQSNLFTLCVCEVELFGMTVVRALSVSAICVHSFVTLRNSKDKSCSVYYGAKKPIYTRVILIWILIKLLSEYTTLTKSPQPNSKSVSMRALNFFSNLQIAPISQTRKWLRICFVGQVFLSVSKNLLSAFGFMKYFSHIQCCIMTVFHEKVWK